jgi:hypothetical protein
LGPGRQTALEIVTGLGDPSSIAVGKHSNRLEIQASVSDSVHRFVESFLDAECLESRKLSAFSVPAPRESSESRLLCFGQNQAARGFVEARADFKVNADPKSDSGASGKQTVATGMAE